MQPDEYHDPEEHEEPDDIIAPVDDILDKLDDSIEPDEVLIDDFTETVIHGEDKIFNNRYNTGDGLSDLGDYEYTTAISVSHEYADSYLKDLYEYEESLELKYILDAIFKFMKGDPEISKILKKSSPDPYVVKAKLSKESVNFIFNRLNTCLDLQDNIRMFFSPIYILEVISSLSSIEYKKIFDMLETDTQELLITELDKKYNFLNGKNHKKKIH